MLANVIIRRFGLLIILLAIGAGAFIFRDRLSGNAGDLTVGDCFDAPTSGLVEQEVKDVQHHPCTEPHSGEVFFVVKNGADKNAAYPDKDTEHTFVQSQCTQPFADYVGTAFEQSALDVQYFAPTAEGWSKGDRVYTCFAVRTDGSPLNATVKGSKL